MSQNAGYRDARSRDDARGADVSGLHTWAATMSFLLLTEFLFGMAVNLFVHIPTPHPGSQAAGFFAGSGRALWWSLTQPNAYLAVHSALALATIALGLAFVVAAVAYGRNRHDARWLWISGLGVLFMIGAGFAGTAYLIHASAVSSMTMATGFALSLCTYLAGLYLDVPPERPG